jgi:hypothetical protein
MRGRRSGGLQIALFELEKRGLNRNQEARKEGRKSGFGSVAVIVAEPLPGPDGTEAVPLRCPLILES